jgi:hypothetical protein
VAGKCVCVCFITIVGVNLVWLASVCVFVLHHEFSCQAGVAGEYVCICVCVCVLHHDFGCESGVPRGAPPLLRVAASAQVTVTLTAAFRWSDREHGSAEPFWLWVEDGESERIHHYEYVLVQVDRNPCRPRCVRVLRACGQHDTCRALSV